MYQCSQGHERGTDTGERSKIQLCRESNRAMSKEEVIGRTPLIGRNEGSSFLFVRSVVAKRKTGYHEKDEEDESGRHGSEHVRRGSLSQGQSPGGERTWNRRGYITY